MKITDEKLIKMSVEDLAGAAIFLLSDGPNSAWNESIEIYGVLSFNFWRRVKTGLLYAVNDELIGRWMELTERDFWRLFLD